MGLEVALQREDPDAGDALRRCLRHYQPREASSCSDSSFEVSMLSIA
jgi:hypothetical protein